VATMALGVLQDPSQTFFTHGPPWALGKQVNMKLGDTECQMSLVGRYDCSLEVLSEGEMRLLLLPVLPQCITSGEFLRDGPGLQGLGEVIGLQLEKLKQYMPSHSTPNSSVCADS